MEKSLRRETSSPPPHRRAPAYVALTACVSAVLVLGSAEALLRGAGIGPWRPAERTGEATVYEPDPVLGWRNKPGHYRLPAPDREGSPVEITNRDDGTRRAGERPPDGRPRLALMGGSFTQGWAVSDQETWAWRLQSRLPGVFVENHGVGGYGTLQSLAALERRLAHEPQPAAVVYGFLGHHEYRNVANAWWLEMLARNASRGHVAVPFATLDGAGGLVRHPPARWPAWPLRDRSAAVTFAERLAMKARTLPRRLQARAVTERLIADMQRVAGSRGLDFAVVLLGANEEQRASYAAFLERRGIRHADCVHPLTPELQVPGDGHPNGRMHALFADCIAGALAPRLAALAPGPSALAGGPQP